MDIVTILRKLRFLENMANVLLNVPQKILLSHQRRDILERDKSSDDDTYSIYNNYSNAIKDSGNKLDLAFRYYSGKKKIDVKDKRIMLGLISRKPYLE